MLLLWEIKFHILRMPVRTLITACVAALLACGMALYLRNIQVTEETLDNMAEQMPVQVHITNRDGSSSVNLRIKSKDFDALAACDVRDILCTSAFSCVLKSVNGQSFHASMRVHGANAIAALDGPAAGDFTFWDGWDESFLQGDQPVCAVEKSFAQKNGLQLGDRLDVDLSSIGGPVLDSIGRHQFTVVALYQDDTQSSWNACAPIAWLRGATEATVDRHGKPTPFFYNSASAYLRTPREMNAFKDAMYEWGFRQRSPLQDVQTLGDALSIDDEMYIKASSEMVENLGLYRAFLPPFFGLIVLSVTLVTFLSLRSSRQQIAIASSLGRQKLLNAAAPFFGTVTVQALGCLAALIVMSLTIGLIPLLAGITLGFFMLCAAGGTALALAFLFRFDAMELLTKTD